MDYSLLSVGNVIKYRGRLPQHSNQNGTIESFREDGALILRIRSSEDNLEHQIAAYPYEIAPIVTNITLLNSLGFTLDRKTNVISRNGVNIVNVAYARIRQDENGRKINHLDIKGFRLVINQISVDRNEDEVMANTIDVNTFHALQNYYSSRLKEVIQLP